MRERVPQILKIVCLGLAAWLAWELVQVGRDVNPLGHVVMPDIPTLPVDTNAPPTVAIKPLSRSGTNAIEAAISTNGLVVAGDTNAASLKRVRLSATNAADITAASTDVRATTNLATRSATNSGPDSNAPTVATAKAATTNEPTAAPIVSTQTNVSRSNLAVALPTNIVVSGTNITIANISAGTNTLGNATRTNLTNSAIARSSSGRSPNAAIPGGAAAKKPATLPPEIQARVDRVYESEIFAPVVHPMPMALLGIAGKAAFLRAPSGQTGMVKEGDSLGDVKLLQIGMNRVLVEQDGNKQELMIFAGLGGESLLTKTNDASNETTKK